ncbi:DUF6765 family protein [Candidatus Bandiella euplotis]|uniref:Uncharacterized protein n=1 Tax=Candidatus Bandiella euplotis TaxID=1664265 RepID=A0ABZ0UMV2_9RICK|nr:hypothetical protein Bandiella_01183 [Candidatus Bandiella woodruffii]
MKYLQVDIEYHYYITYLIANISGFQLQESYIIAHSSQYVDDNDLELDVYNCKKTAQPYRNMASSLKDLSCDKKKMENMLMAFHFLPGDTISNRKDGQEHSRVLAKDRYKIALLT